MPRTGDRGIRDQTLTTCRGTSMIHLLPSADYEFYLGRNFSREEEVLFEPTERLLAMYESLGLRTTLFCDVACIWRYREWGREEIASRMEQQMADALARGHDVQAHLHPHWLHARQTDDGGYQFDPRTYLLGTLDEDEAKCRLAVEHLARRTITYLNQLLQPVDANYRCIAFRAGGYGLQPRTPLILEALIKAGFVIDSSIIPGFVFRSSTHQVDFTHTPNHPNYWLSPRTGLTQPGPDGEGLFEIPIPAIHLTPVQGYLFNLPEALRQGLTILAGRESNHERKGAPCGETSPMLTASRWRRAYWRSRALLQTRFHRLEAGPCLRPMLATFDGHLRRFSKTHRDLHLSLNCHPKGMTSRHFDVLRRFHQHAGSSPTMRHLTFFQAWNQLQSAIPSP
ncbi:MAG: hypothetical protein HQL83_02755 [Magnetococcales bacterium]|nr:hypothetical protein [Magnetococcales bacterium]